MFDEVLEIIKKAGIFLVLAQTILQLCAGEAYEKYIRMIVGLISAMLLFLPVIELIRSDGLQSFEEYRLRYEKELLSEEMDFEAFRDAKWEAYLEENIEMEIDMQDDL